jgi:hypothetical protein
VRHYATGLWPRFATLVRGSSRRITTMKAGESSILEYQSDQPSMKLLGPLSILLPFTTGKDEPPHFSLAGSFHISGASDSFGSQSSCVADRGLIYSVG